LAAVVTTLFNVRSAGKQANASTEKWQMPSFDQDAVNDAADGTDDVAGYNEGFEQGRQEAQQLLTADAERLQQLVRSMTAPAELLSSDIRDELLATAFAVAKLILQREIAQSPEDFKVLIDEAIAALPVAQGEVKIALHPDDIALLATDESTDAQPLSIVPDADISRGSCRVSRDASVVQGGIDGLIQQLASKHTAQ
jgi:flagellar biosynthesis/type III secretory pathway protein FliH